MKDNPIHPNHYKHLKINGKDIEVIDLIKGILHSYNYSAEEGADLFNVFKYILRYPYKGHPKMDIGKAIYYLNDLKNVVKDPNDNHSDPKDSQKDSIFADLVKRHSSTVSALANDTLNKLKKDFSDYINNSDKESIKDEEEPTEDNESEEDDSIEDIKKKIADMLENDINSEKESNDSDNEDDDSEIPISLVSSPDNDIEENGFNKAKFKETDKKNNYFSTISGLDENSLLQAMSNHFEADDGKLNAVVVFDDNFDGYLKLRFKLRDTKNDKLVRVTLHVFYDYSQIDNYRKNAIKLIYEAFYNSIPEKYSGYVESDKDNYMMDISQALSSALNEDE